MRVGLHRCRSQGTREGPGAAAPPPLSRAKPLFFGQTLNFSGRSQQPKMKKVFIKRKERNSFCAARWNARNPGFLLTIIGWGESNTVILQVGITIFSGTVKIFFGQRWLSPLEKLARTPVRVYVMFKSVGKTMTFCQPLKLHHDCDHDSCDSS